MTQALYRKYRPQTFAEVIGQEHIKVTLANALEQGRVGHAYLLTGPRGLGKTTVARLLAKAVNCTQRQPGQAEPCNACASCAEVAASRSLDVMEIDAASHTGVDHVREHIIASARFAPTQRRFKVFIIDEVHMLSTSAFNALLKTLEEPPEHTIFILATTEVHKVPATIASRCQRFDFHFVSHNLLVARLLSLVAKEERQVPPSVLEAIARQSGGSVRDAESLLGQLLSLEGKEISEEQAQLILPTSQFNEAHQLLTLIADRQAGQAVRYINQLLEEGVDLVQLCRSMIEHLRLLLLLRLSGQVERVAVQLSEEEIKQLAQLGQQLGPAQIVRMIEAFTRRLPELKQAEIIQLPLELAIVELVGDAEPAPAPLPSVPPEASSAPAVKSAGAEDVARPASKRAAAKPAAKAKMTLQLPAILEKWGQVLSNLKEHNHSLASTLRQHKPTGVNGDGQLQIGFKYRFHQQRVLESKNRQILESVLEQVYGQRLAVAAIIVEQLPASPDEEVDDLLTTFGGQLID